MIVDSSTVKKIREQLGCSLREAMQLQERYGTLSATMEAMQVPENRRQFEDTGEEIRRLNRENTNLIKALDCELRLKHPLAHNDKIRSWIGDILKTGEYKGD